MEKFCKVSSKNLQFTILKYQKGEDEVAITLNKNTRICGKRMFETKIKNVFVVLVEENEEYLDNQKLAISEYNTDTIYEAELRAALNSLELSTDNLYRDINYRICLLQCQQILTTQAMLQNQLEIMRDEKGHTLYSHTSGEVAEIHKCKKIVVKARLNDEKCCEELAVWVGERFEKPAYMKAISRQVSSVCTPRVCSRYNVPWFDIGSEEEDLWVKIDDGEIIMAQKPRELKLTSHSKEEQFIMKEDDIFDDSKKEQFKVFGLIHQTRNLIQGEIVQRMYPSEVLMKLNDDTDLENTDEESFISYRLQDAILPWPINMLHILPDWLIITVLGIVGLLLLKVLFDPMVACCTLVGDSSLSIIQRLSSIIVPVTSISFFLKGKYRRVSPSVPNFIPLKLSKQDRIGT